MSLSDNAKRALVWNYVLTIGKCPEWAGDDEVSRPVRTFAKIAGLSEADAFAAYAELEDTGMIERRDGS